MNPFFLGAWPGFPPATLPNQNLGSVVPSGAPIYGTSSNNSKSFPRTGLLPIPNLTNGFNGHSAVAPPFFPPPRLPSPMVVPPGLPPLPLPVNGNSNGNLQYPQHFIPPQQANGFAFGNSNKTFDGHKLLDASSWLSQCASHQESVLNQLNNQLISETSNGVFYESSGTVVLPNDEIQEVTMEKDDSMGEDSDSPFELESTEEVSLLDIDNYLNQEGPSSIDLQNSKSLKSLQISIKNDDIKQKCIHRKNGGTDGMEDYKYWKSTQDRDYRLQDNVKNLKKKVKNMSRKKSNRSIKRRDGIDLTKKPKPPVKNDFISENNLDNLSYEDLISLYGQLKTELTVMSIEDEHSHMQELQFDEMNGESNDGISFSEMEQLKLVLEGEDSGINIASPAVPELITIDDDSESSEVSIEVISPIPQFVEEVKKDESTKEEKKELSLEDSMKVNQEELPQDESSTVEESKQKDPITLLPKPDFKPDSSITNTLLLSSADKNKSLNALEEMIRKRLLQSMSSSIQASPAEPINESIIKAPAPLPVLPKSAPEVPLSVKTLPAPIKVQSTKSSKLLKVRPSGPKKPIIDLSKYSLVIQLSGSESESDEEENVSVSPIKRRSSVTPLANVNIGNLSKSQQQEYRKLTRELARRELKNITMDNLKKYELQFGQSLMALRHKKLQISTKGKSLDTFQKKFKKTTARFNKLQRDMAMIQKQMKMQEVQVQLTLKEVKALEESIKNEQQKAAEYRRMCVSIGTKLVGLDYIPPISQSRFVKTSVENQNVKKRLKTMNKLKEDLTTPTTDKKTAISQRYLKFKVKSLLKTALNSSETLVLFEHCLNFNFALFRCSLFHQTARSLVPFSDFTESSGELFDSSHRFMAIAGPTADQYHSVLTHFNSYRFATHQLEADISSNCWSNALNPTQFICIYDLLGMCRDSKCQFQHQKDYIYDPQEKICDLLTYLPDFAESLNLEELKSDPKAMKEALMKYVQKKKAELGKDISVEEVCRKLAEQVQCQTKISTSSLMIRMLPKEVANFSDVRKPKQTAAPFGDYVYQFDIRGESFQLRLSQFSKKEDDPELYLKNRFFAPQGIPITASLEASLSNDPNNIQMWLKLAYSHMSKVNEGQEVTQCLDSALNVLSRGLDHNRDNSELYENYLLFYSNKLTLVEQSNATKNDEIEIQELCPRILKFCSTYRLWICYLNLSNKLHEKEKISLEIINRFANNEIKFDSEEQQSFNILEIIFYRINLLLHLNMDQQALTFFNTIFIPQSSLSKVAELVVKRHRVFAWLCYIHLVLYKCLPYHCFQLSKRGCFQQLLNTHPFVFKWNTIMADQQKLRQVENIFKRALKSCCPQSELHCSCSETDPMQTCFPLRLNQTNLNKFISRNSEEGESNSYHLSFMYSQHGHVLSHLHTLQLFDTDLEGDAGAVGNEALNLIENFQDSYSQSQIASADQKDVLSLLQNQLKFNYWLAFYQFKNRQTTRSKQILTKNLKYYYLEVPVEDDGAILKFYETILFDDYENKDFDRSVQIKSMLKANTDQRHCTLVYLYLSYLLYVHIVGIESGSTPESHYLRLDCIFSSVMNAFSSSTSNTQDHFKLLWLNYFLLLLEFPFDENHFKVVYDNFRHLCVTFNSVDPVFIFHLTNAFSEMINPQDRFYFLLEISKLNPDNVNLMLKVLDLALQLSKKETLWKLINFVVYQKKVRLQCFEFWKIAISLSIERNDHLNSHKFFQIAISLMPFNQILWTMLKNYETSINHEEHLSQIRHFYCHTLHMVPSNLFLTDNASI